VFVQWDSEIVEVLARTIIVYFVVFLALRLMGKREIGKLSVFDLVISIMIAEGAVLLIENTKRSIWFGLAPIALVVVLQIVMSWVTLKNRKARNWFEGSPSIIVRNGHLNRDEMRKQRYSLDDLMLQLREHDITDLNEVDYAVLETTGKLSVIKHGADNPDQTDLFSKFRYEALPIPLIMDGEIQRENLSLLGQSDFWLRRTLQNYGIKELKDVFLCTIDHKGQLYVDRK
jgi:uncharacterized membrane protein YcaP (DUF421 family)